MKDATSASDRDAESLEANLRSLWCRLLGLEDIAAEEDFFERGGVSLQAILTATWLQELYGDAIPTDVVYKAPTIASLLRFCGPLERVPVGKASVGAAARSRERLYPLAPQSHEFLNETFWARADATAQLIVRLPPDVDRKRLAAALRAVVHHHEALRMELVQGRPQEYHLRERADPTLELPTIVLQKSSDLSIPSGRQAVFREYLGAFDPFKDPLLSAVLVDSPSGQLLLIRASHLIVDQRASELIVTELSRAYVGGETYSPASQSYRYSEFLAEADRQRKAAEAYWEQYLLGSRSAFLTCVDRAVSRHDVVQERKYESYALPREELIKACRRLGLSEFGLLFALFQLALRNHCDADRFVVSSTLTGRLRPAQMQVIGSFSSIVFFNCVVSLSDTPASLANRLSAQISEAHRHMHVSREVLNRLSGRIDLNRIDIVNFTVAIPPGHLPEDLSVQWPIQVEGVPKSLVREAPDISVNVSVGDRGIDARYTYCPGRVQPQDVERLARTYGNLLRSLDGQHENGNRI